MQGSLLRFENRIESSLGFLISENSIRLLDNNKAFGCSIHIVGVVIRVVSSTIQGQCQHRVSFAARSPPRAESAHQNGRLNAMAFRYVFAVGRGLLESHLLVGFLDLLRCRTMFETEDSIMVRRR